jgi:glycosyltransferase involved in cell wall biosynthesis
MTVAAVMMVRDEADIIRHTLDHLLAEGIDKIIVADNLSVDDTRHILATYEIDHPDRIVVLEDDEPGYYQDRKMTELARYAHKHHGAEWILPCDADERFYSPTGTLAEFFASCTHDIVTASGWDHIVTDDDDPTEQNPFRRITHRRVGPQKLPKVAFRYDPEAWIDFGNHAVFHHPGVKGAGLKYRHFQYRSFEQMCQKLRQGKEAYDATNLHPTYGAHWREGGALSDDELWRKWRRLCEEPGLVDDPL